MSSAAVDGGVTAPGDAGLTVVAVLEGLLGGVPVGELDAVELGERLRVLDGVRRWVEAESAVVIAEADRRRLHRQDGHTRVAGWCRSRVRWSPGETLARVRTARLLADIGVVRDRLAAGEVGVAQVQELARVYANPRAAVRMPEFVDILLEHARTLPFEDFRVVVGRWEALADQDGSERAHEVSHRNRRASLHVDGHHTWLDASGGNVDGAQMREIFDRYCQAEYLADWADARDRHGDLASAHDLPRSGRQRAWDALLRIFLDAASTPADAQPPEPVLHVAGDVHTVTEVLAALVAHLDSDTPSSESEALVVPDRPHDPAHARCATLTGVQLPRSAILDALVFGRLRRVVFDGAGVPVDVGRRRRFFTDAMRDALAVHTSRCVYTGCEQPLHRLQTDHLTGHADGGATATRNASLLCGHHNRIKNRGFTVWRDPGGLWHTYRPDGTELTPV